MNSTTTSAAAPPKATSYAYGEAHQKQMLEFYRLSQKPAEDNTEYLRLRLVNGLVEEAFRLQGGEGRRDTVVLDIGCSIGTFALEAAKAGFRAYGVDFDEAAIRIARELAAEERVDAQFVAMDAADWTQRFPPIDIAVGADIFEHLHDDELGALFVSLRKNMSSRGLLVFHTLPQQYDYLFFRNGPGRMELPLVLRPFQWLPDEQFTRIVRSAALAYDIYRIMTRPDATTWQEHIKRTGHPNPLTQARLTDILARAGWEVVRMATRSWDCQMDPRRADFFRKRTVTHRSLYGIARPRASQSGP
jgi:2-polyprenyl-3-methyl-5-hydroxy-6-metoxy-1,4-benzoquinol methylase